jgi:hypothetical protein
VDDIPDQVNGGFRLQATYSDNQKKELPINSPNITWQIRPHYSNGASKTGSGDIVVGVGKNDNNYTVGSGYRLGNAGSNSIIGVIGEGSAIVSQWNNAREGTLTAIHPLQEVYTVLEIALDPPLDEANLDSLPSMYYWEDDQTPGYFNGNDQATRREPSNYPPYTRPAYDTTYFWVDKLGSGYGLNVTYTNGNTKRISLADAQKYGMIWNNQNPYKGPDNRDTFEILNVRESSRVGNKAAVNYNKIAEPKVKINYRGATTEVPVDIWNKVDAINAVYKAEVSPLEVNVKARDNDIGGNDAYWYADQVTITATMTSARGNTGSSGNKGELALKFAGTLDAASDLAGAPNGVTYVRPTDRPFTPSSSSTSGAVTATNADKVYAKYYTMNFGVANTYNFTTQLFNSDGYNQASLPGNNEKEKSVTFYYAIPTGPTYSGVTTAKVLKNTLSVYWKNINVR